MNKGSQVLILVLGIFLLSCQVSEGEKTSRTKVFEKLEADYTGIEFVNRIEADIQSNYNVFDFDFFYNGSGVATVDINNDGLLDLVFTANQELNRLYLNKGDLKFQDVTEGSGINTGKGWSTGVAFADINGDGWQDLYISQGGPNPGEKSRNLLLINQKNLTFVESASEYGLADESISSQSAFFDFDKDGDLDCIVMNENKLYGTNPQDFYAMLSQDEALAHHSSSHLYRNEGGTYTDITRESGMLSPSFGLGLIVSDINDDSWLDIYIANDYYVPDALFINNQDGSFTNRIAEYTNQVSFFGMGVDIADINEDTYPDIFVLDMAASDHYRSKTLMASMNVEAFDLLTNELDLHHQYMFNSLQLNSGDGYFKNIAHLTKMAKSDWSWSVLMNDFDNSTSNDIFISNGYRKYALNNDIRTSVLEARIKHQNKVPIEVKEEIYDKMPSEKLSNLVFSNSGDLDFQNVTEEWGLSDLSFSNGAAYADLDNDGDLDLVVNNIDDKAFLYKNTTRENNLGNYLKVRLESENPHTFAKVTAYSDGTVQRKESLSVRGYLSAMDPSVHFGLGEGENIDSLVVNWLSGNVEKLYNVPVNQEISLKEASARNAVADDGRFIKQVQTITGDSKGINFSHRENVFDDFEIETLLPYKQSKLGPHISVGDVNNDGLEDFFIGGAIGQSGQLFVQTTDKTFFDATSDEMRVDFLYEDMESVFMDVDNDGDQDLYVVSGGYEFEAGAASYEDRLYINNGFGKYQKAIDSTLSTNRLSGKSVTTLDYDQDGIEDILVGTRVIPGQFPVSDRSVLYRNTGTSLVDVTDAVIPDLNEFGMINKVLATDFNQDGRQDLIVLGEWTGIGLFENTGGKFANVSDRSDLSSKKGWWFTIAELDLNGDKLPDYVVGNLGLNSKYSTSTESPLKLYASDFDENGSWDVVFSNSYKGNYVPFRGRECSSNQMPFIANDFPSYDLFAKATIEDIYGDKLSDAHQFEVTDFKSIVLVNKGNGSFDAKPLPKEAQVSPILDLEVVDIDRDGFDDIVAIGTIYDTEVETPRLDMGSGTVLLSNGVDGFNYNIELNRKIRLPGNLKSIKQIEIGEEVHLLVGRNSEAPLLVALDQLFTIQ